MAKIVYKSWKPRAEAKDMVDIANRICAEYAADGYDLTLRQLYYQFVARGFIANNQQSYNRLGDVINNARLAGLMDWNYIVDRTRSLEGHEYFAKPGDAVLKAARSYAEDLWKSQPLRIEVWVEKEALASVIERVSKSHSVDSFACRGYVSQSELWSAGQRIRKYIERGQRVLLLHLGDHDPSGIDMTRDITERLGLFIERDWHRVNVDDLGYSCSLGDIRSHMADHVGGEQPLEVRRIALNMDQVERYNPPPNPAKITDTRAEKYIEQYGDESWELDALDPTTIRDLVDRHIVTERDDIRWDRAVKHETEARADMVKVAERWAELAPLLASLPPKPSGAAGASGVDDDISSESDLSGRGDISPGGDISLDPLKEDLLARLADHGGTPLSSEEVARRLALGEEEEGDTDEEDPDDDID